MCLSLWQLFPRVAICLPVVHHFNDLTNLEIPSGSVLFLSLFVCFHPLLQVVFSLHANTSSSIQLLLIANHRLIVYVWTSGDLREVGGKGGFSVLCPLQMEFKYHLWGKVGHLLSSCSIMNSTNIFHYVVERKWCMIVHWLACWTVKEEVGVEIPTMACLFQHIWFLVLWHLLSK